MLDVTILSMPGRSGLVAEILFGQSSHIDFFFFFKIEIATLSWTFLGSYTVILSFK